MGSEPGGFIFPALIFAITFGLAIYRARNEPPWKIVLAIWIGLGMAALMVLALLWAGTDTTRLTILVVPVAITAVLAAVALVARSIRRWRAAPRAKSPFDFT